MVGTVRSFAEVVNIFTKVLFEGSTVTHVGKRWCVFVVVFYRSALFACFVDFSQYYKCHSLQVDCPVVLPSSVSTLLQACPRLSPHFTIGPLTAPEGATPTPLTPPLADFVNINPFKMSSKTVALAPPKAQSCDTTSGCCGSTTTTDPASSTKTGCDATPSETNGGCCGNGTEPPPAKRSCC